MNLLQLFRRNPGRELSRLGHLDRKQRIRARVDQMRADMNLPPVAWPR